MPTGVVKQRSREVSALVDSWEDSYTALVGTRQQCWVVDTAADQVHVVGHTKSHAQVRPFGEDLLLYMILEEL